MNYETAFPLLNEYRSKHRPDMANGVCYEGDDFIARLSARDPEKQEVIYMLTDGALPMGAFLDPSQGTVSGTLELKHFDTGELLMGDHTWYFTVGAFDGVNTRHQDFSITVKHINTPPTWAAESYGPILEMYEGNSIAQATVFEAYTLVGTGGYSQIRVNGSLISGTVNFGASLNATAQAVVTSINATSSNPEYKAVYISGSTFKVLPTADITCSTNGNMVVVKKTGDAAVMAVDQFGNEAIGNNVVGYKILGAIDPEFEFNPNALANQTLTYRAEGRLFDREGSNAIANCTITMQSNGVMIGALPQHPPIPPGPGIVSTNGQEVPMNIFVNDGEYDVPRAFSIFVKNVNQAPYWVSPDENTELGPVTEGETITPITLVANDWDGDNLTYTISNVTVGANAIATTLANTGLSLSTVNNTAVLTGVPSNAAVPPEENIANTIWYLANPNGASMSPAPSSYYGIVDGKTVFRSKPNETLFVTTEGAVSNPAMGSRYVIQYSIRKIQDSTNGVIGYVRPAFDGFTGGPQPTVLGQRSGFGYVADINNVGYDFFDTSLWELNKWYLIRAEYTVNQAFTALRGRIRMNRSAFNAGGPPYFNGSGYINRADGPPYSNALFEMRGYSISKNDSQTYTMTADVSDGEYTSSRIFKLTIGNADLPPVWDTAAGDIGAGYSNAPYNKQLAAHDPEGNAITYTLVSGSLPAGLNLSSTGLISGTVTTVVSDTPYSFTVRASDGSKTADRSFSMTAMASVNGPPIWQTPSGTIVSSGAGSSISFQLSAIDPEGDAVTYAVTGGSLPPGVTMGSDGAISGTLPNVGANTDYSFTVTASSGSPVQTAARAFTITATFAAAPFLYENGTEGTHQFVVPAGIFQLNVEMMLGAGGGGGAGTQIASGGGGGGGGSGAVLQNITIPCNPGETFNVTIGTRGGGQLPPGNSTNFPLGDGTPGGATILSRGGDVWTAPGGQGGKACPNVAKNQHANAAGGAGGSPGGNTGADGLGGASDYSSSPGGKGADSPLGAGGAPGNGGPGTNGGNATGFGAGGGGAGSYDRSGPGWWIGGLGSGGYIKVTG